MTEGKHLMKELRPNVHNITVSFGNNSKSKVLGLGKVVVAHNITLVEMLWWPPTVQGAGVVAMSDRSCFLGWLELLPWATGFAALGSAATNLRRRCCQPHPVMLHADDSGAAS
jgi:hypothetical protein